MLNRCQCKILLISLLLFSVLLTCMEYIDDLFGGGGSLGKCMVCTKVSYNGHLTNWTISHFVFFMILGMICPDSIGFIIAIGVFWEFVELFFEYLTKNGSGSILCKYVVDTCTHTMSNDDFWKHYLGFKEHSQSLYWCSSGFVGQILDIIFDVAGVYTGAYLAKNHF
jgi:hypothetical protein